MTNTHKLLEQYLKYSKCSINMSNHYYKTHLIWCWCPTTSGDLESDYISLYSPTLSPWSHQTNILIFLEHAFFFFFFSHLRAFAFATPHAPHVSHQISHVWYLLNFSFSLQVIFFREASCCLKLPFLSLVPLSHYPTHVLQYTYNTEMVCLYFFSLHCLSPSLELEFPESKNLGTAVHRH